MARIDKKLALDLMLAGENDSDIAKHFGTSRQAVNLVRRRLVEDGSLDAGHSYPRQGKGGGSAALVDITSRKRTAGVAPTSTKSTTYAPSYEQITEWIIEIINEASDAKTLRRELESIEAISSRLEQEIEQLRRELLQATTKQGATLAKASKYENAIRSLGSSVK